MPTSSKSNTPRAIFRCRLSCSNLPNLDSTKLVSFIVSILDGSGRTVQTTVPSSEVH